VPLFMDVHEVPGGVAMEDVAKAHLADLQTQDAYDVRYLRYWVDEKSGGSSAWPRRRPRTPRRRFTGMPTDCGRPAHGRGADGRPAHDRPTPGLRGRAA